MPIAQVGAGLFTAPLFVLIFSAAILGHRIGPRRLVAVAIGFAGVLAGVAPGPGEPQPAPNDAGSRGCSLRHGEPSDPRMVRR